METVDKYQLAVQHFENREFSPAVKFLLELLEENPQDIDALNFLGIIMLNLGKYEEAESFLEKVLTQYEPHPIAHYNMGLCCIHFKKNEEACMHFKRAMEINPEYIDAINNLGVVQIELNEFDKAEQNFNRVISLQPANSKAYNNRGNLYYNQGRFELAEKNYLEAVNLEPGNHEYNFNLGNCLLKQKELNEALKYFLRTAELSPEDTLAYNNIGLTLFKLHRYEEAEKYFSKALSKDPMNAEAHFNLAECYREQSDSASQKGFLKNAIESFNKAYELDPNLKGALINIGNIHKKLGNEKEAENYFGQVGNGDEEKVIAFTNLGVLRMGIYKIDEAIEYFNLAIKANNSVCLPHYNKAHALLIKGDFSEGWKEYEWRKKREEFHARTFSKPELVPGTDVKGKTILVYAEQGFGDTIQFIRFVPQLIERGAKVIVECSEVVYGLFSYITKGATVIKWVSEDEPDVDYDYQIPMLSLPLFLDIHGENFSPEVPYIFADPLKASAMAKLINNNNNIKVGIVWGGNPKHTSDYKRSVRLSMFRALLNVEDVRLFAIQKGDPLAQAVDINFPLIVLSDYIKDFTDTAAIIDNLDLVITIDTSVAHLAGAMGKPVWMVLPYFPDWRWMLNRKDSPWYPSMKIFRQVEDENWDTVFNDLVNELIIFKKNMKNNITSPGLKLAFDDKQPVKGNNAEKTTETIKQKGKLFLGLSGTGDFGWGIVNKYLRQEVSNRVDVKSLELNQFPTAEELKDAKIFQLVRDLDFNPLFEIRGKENYGYTVFENELTSKSIENAKSYDKVITASTWDYNKLISAGINNAGLAIQGVDPNMFYPDDQVRNNNLFVIFSGGKFEIRKGQDLVLKAISILQKKYPDIVLVNAWYNVWVESIRLMRFSKYIKYEEKDGTWEDFMNNIYYLNGIDPKRVFTLPLVPNKDLRQVYLKSDIGLFPNRCEGGTNLVMMEYMACGKPVIASYNTGHKDILNSENSLMLEQMTDYKLYDDNNVMFADWEEPSLDEIIDKIEYAYHNREELKIIGSAAADTMKNNFTWSHTAINLLQEVGL